MLLTIALGSIVGCSPYVRPPLSAEAEARIRRETTLDDAPEGSAQHGDAVVRVVGFGKGGAGACSGAVIGRRHVLTAQHCVVKRDHDKELTTNLVAPGDLHVELGGGYLPWGRLGVRELHACEGYTGDLEHDVAVVVLSAPLPSDVASFGVSYDVPKMAAVFELSGFGTNAAPRGVHHWGGLIATNRHVYEGPILEVTDARIAFRIPGAPGDSGGPIVDTATGHVVSVTSRGRSREDTDEPLARGPSSGLFAPPSAARYEPLVTGPRLATCRATIDAALAR